MVNWGWIVGIIIGLQYIGYGYWYVHTNYIRPFLYYKLVIFDRDDEFIFFRKKKKAVVFNEHKGYYLFDKKGNGEFYRIPITESDTSKNVSKRDDRGHVSYYYFRNNPNPLVIMNKDRIDMNNDASLMANVMKTKMFNSSLMLEERSFKINWFLIVGVLIIMLVVIFHKQIATMLGI